MDARRAKKLHRPNVVDEYTAGNSPFTKYTTLNEPLMPNLEPSTIIGTIDL